MAGQSRVSRQKHKDKKIIIYEAIYNQEPGGFPSCTYKPIHPNKLWAYVRQLFAHEKYMAATIKVEEEMLFVVNWRQDLASPKASIGLYIEYNGYWYDVKRIDTFEGYKQDLQVYGKLEISPPKEESISPYVG